MAKSSKGGGSTPTARRLIDAAQGVYQPLRLGDANEGFVVKPSKPAVPPPAILNG
jgi:hypothetical protein